MRYTLWSRDRLLGDTDLGFAYTEDQTRCGWLHPTALGDRLLPFATGVAAALRMLSIVGMDPTARADVASAVDQEDALELELRGASGAVIRTESIAIIDAQYLFSIPISDPGDEVELDEELEALLEEWSSDSEATSGHESEAEFPRYQIQVRVVDGETLF